MLKNGFKLLLLFLTFSLALSQDAKIDQKAPEFTLQDVNGMDVLLSDYKGKIIVLEWINFDCPFVKKHYNSSNIPKMQEEYTKKGVIWMSICSSAPGKQGYFSPGEIRKRIKEHNAKMTFYLIDSDGKVGKTYGAKTTPHFFIIDKDFNLVYSGAIDDKPTSDIDDIPTAKNYVRLVLDSLLKGSKPSIKTTKPYGCSVKY
ncbi:MAG: thioredoxin family protein [Ignavibacteria bacterium]|nr:thioredoxin family protein [Ignavibacteria bacterium]